MPALEPAGGDGGEEHRSPAAAEKTLFGKYEVGRLLGYGAFAKVYHARDIHTEHSVAIKAINKANILKGGLAANVKREISIMRRLRHPHIVRLFEVLANKKKIYFVLEFAKGGELFAKISKSRFSENLSRRYFQQLISAVGYCHSRGVYHRDLKPENLLLDENWNLKVTDFGLSALTDQVRQDGLLHTLCGTPAYVAPEVLSKKGYDGAKVDVWSCGIILFVLNAGYLPFNDPNLMVMYRKIYKGEFRVPKWTSPGLKNLLSRLLDTNPETRITVDDIINDPWFRVDYKQVQFHEEYLELKDDYEDDDVDDTSSNGGGGGDNLKVMNAFDIISLSSGYNLGGLFEEEGGGDTSVAEGEGMTVVRKKEWCCVKVVGGYNCNFVMVVELKRLTREIVVVEVRSTESEVGHVGPANRIWKDKIRPQLMTLFHM
ncbi:hypothetical protein CTI12_AA436390 [Artemisia annua]|uniref:non-specific serine/threonine protein kinase n=1 Tax=Artemisia annua TaxID=35608 RepID=A0A2U1LZH1_ARTAN|nr:hypothetical protein CTI12_AA436390 [Artemisia annua]